MKIKAGRGNLKYRGQKSKNDARKCPEQARVQMRIRGVLAIRKQGLFVKDIARALGVCESCVSRWLARYDAGGLDALESAKSRHKDRRILTEDEEEKLCHLVYTSTPLQNGYSVILWTRKVVASLVQRLFTKKISESTAGRIMRRHGMSAQKPMRRARQRDPEEVKEWCTKIYPELHARAELDGAEIFWLDEAQMRSDHACGTTWGKKGETPVVPADGQPYRLNAIGTVGNDGTVSIMTFEGSMNSSVFCAYVEHLYNSCKGKVIIITDNAVYHKSAAVRDFLQKYSGWLEVHYLPKYAPDLNPMELIWSLLKSRELNKRTVECQQEFVALAEEKIRELSANKEKCSTIFGKKELAYIPRVDAKLAA